MASVLRMATAGTTLDEPQHRRARPSGLQRLQVARPACSGIVRVWDLAATVAYAGVDPTLEGRALQDALIAAIASRGGYCWWDVDHAG
jgi:hypothetical protein